MRFFGVFLSRKENAWRSVHSPWDYFIIIINSDRSDWRDTRGKWPLARNPDRSWWHRHTSLWLFGRSSWLQGQQVYVTSTPSFPFVSLPDVLWDPTDLIEKGPYLKIRKKNIEDHIYYLEKYISYFELNVSSEHILTFWNYTVCIINVRSRQSFPPLLKGNI